MATVKKRFVSGIIITTDNLSRIDLAIQANPTASRVVTIPDATTTLLGHDVAQTVTNKNIDADLNTITNIKDDAIKTGAGINAAKLHDGSVSNTEFGFLNGVTSAIQTQLDTVNTGLSDHLSDTSDAHDASSISIVPAGNLSATNTQDALNELQTDIDSTNTTFNNHLIDATDAHDASAISVVPVGNISSLDVQAALQEIQTELDGAANQQLSNLAPSTTINSNLIQDGSGRTVGSAVTPWDEMFAYAFTAKQGGSFQLRDSSNVFTGYLSAEGALLPSSVTSYAALSKFGTSATGPLGIFTADVNTAGDSSDLLIETGNTSVDDSGNISLRTGTAVGTRGEISLNGRQINANSTKIVNVTDPTAAQDVATKYYVDSVASGLLDFKNSVRLATTTALPAYTAVGSGIGKTLTASSNGALSIDSIAVVAGNRVLIKDEGGGTSVHNGIYDVTQAGSAGTPYILTRSTDADGSPSGEVSAGLFCFITEGAANADKGFVLSTNDPIIVDSTAISFTLFTSAGGGANTSLSNLTATSVSQSLIPNSDSSLDLGSSDSNIRWNRIFARKMQVENSNNTWRVFLASQLTGYTSTPSGASITGALIQQTSTSGGTGLGIFTDTTFAGSSEHVFIETGNGSANSGNITLNTGTAGIGTRGSIFLKGNKIEVSSNIVPNTSGVHSLGTSSLRLLDLYSLNANFQDLNMFGNLQLSGSSSTTPSGNSSSNRIFSSSSGSLTIYTPNNATNDSVATGSLRLETGNKTAGTGNSGNITLLCGSSAGGLQGEVILAGRQTNANTRKIVNMADPTAAQDAATKAYVDAKVVPAASAISALDIDWALSETYYKSIAANSTFTFSNLIDGKSITVALTNTSGGAVTVAFPTAVKRSDFPTSIPASKSNVYVFTQMNGVTYASGTDDMA